MLERELLSGEHAELSATAGELLAELEADAPRIAAIASLRWRLRRKLGAHLVKEDRLLYPRLQASDDAAVASCAKRFAAEMGGLADAYARYMTDWSADRIAADWRGFAIETRTVIAALAHRIAREENELYPLMRKSA